ncbi:MAG: lipopolysaccharide biosynthesis protein [Oscillospiraceae bacterium]|nr:lipopolysaccharide biosynthesis protein [Oscillospiraceae bacterium]
MKQSNNNTDTVSMLSGVGWSFAQRILPQLVTLLVSIVLARLLSPEHYGIISIVSVFIAIGDALAIGGFGNALIQKKDANKTDFNSICWVSLTVSMVIYTALFISAPFMARFYSAPILTPVIRVMGTKVVFSAFNSVQLAYVQKKMVFRKSFFSTVGGSLVSSVVGISMALSGCGIWSLVAQHLSNAVIHTIVLFFMIDWKPELEVSWKSVKELWNYGAKVLGATLIFTVRDNIRTLLVGKRFSSSDLAYYNQGQKYPSLLVTDIVAALGNVLFPVMSKNQTDIGKVKALMRNAICISSYVLLPAMAGLFAVSNTFVQVVLTDKWLPCVPFLRIMCLVYVTRSLSTIFQKAILSIGKSSLNLIHEATTSTLTIALLFVAVFVFDSVIMIAFSQVAVTLVGVTLYVVWVRKLFGYSLREMLKDYLPPVAMSCVMTCVVMAVGMIPMPGVVKLVIQVLVGVAIYIGLSIIFKDASYRWIKLYVVRLLHKKAE